MMHLRNIICYALLSMVPLLLGSCHRESHNNSVDMKKITYLALGDSYTIGEAVQPEDRWPVMLSEALTGAGLPAYPPLIVAQTGWTTDELMDAIQVSHIDPPFDLVTLLIGVNNQYRGRDTAEFRAQLKALLDTAVLYAGGCTSRVFVLSIPDWGVTPFAAASGRDPEGIASEIDAFNQVIEAETGRMNIRFIDVTGISRQASSDSTLLAHDGLHPSGKMYARWVEKVIPFIIKELKQQDQG